MKTTCGIAIVNRDRILLCHLTGVRGNGAWNVPKGLNEEYEDYLDTAIREVREETNLDLKGVRDQIGYVGSFNYRNTQKRLKLFLYESLENIDMGSLKCESYTSGGFPEVDQYEMVPLDYVMKMAHHTSLDWLPVIKEALKK